MLTGPSMLHPVKLHSFYAIAILSSLFLACLITNRHLPGHEKPVAAARPQNAAVYAAGIQQFLSDRSARADQIAH